MEENVCTHNVLDKWLFPRYRNQAQRPSTTVSAIILPIMLFIITYHGKASQNENEILP